MHKAHDAADSSYTSMRVLSTVVSVVLPLCQLCHALRFARTGCRARAAHPLCLAPGDRVRVLADVSIKGVANTKGMRGTIVAAAEVD